MAQGVLVFAEVAQGGVAAIAKEMLGAGRRLADALDRGLTALPAMSPSRKPARVSSTVCRGRTLVRE